MRTVKIFASALTLSLLFLIPTNSSASTNAQKRKTRPARAHTAALTRAEVKDAEARLAEMGYGTGRNALIAFQKWEGRKVTSQLTRDEFDAIMNASAPQPKDSGYKHVEVDLDRQVLLMTDSNGAIERILPVST